MRAIIRATALLATLLAAAPAAGDELLEAPRRRQGGYLSLGLHGGRAYHRHDGHDLGPATATATTLRFGQLLTRRFGLGLVIDLGFADGDGEEAFTTGYGLEAHVEVAPNLAVRGGVSVGILALDVDDGDDPSAYGAAYTLAVAYDWFLFRGASGGFALTPTAQARALPEDVKAYSVFVGIELSWWMGLPRNQLEGRGD